ncbi:hypothetical protein FISHEDRAFT_62946 [Fistulina hepatica ATCC 64428]|uniref:Uncharacterized protein n=1 Tax=Fistulina hepatica ATCC 64428 TaxID=1128425 RepID=A0A0D6ZZ46_9AGAR|nr:hypothetical protein FISHEDRAFT_62946 [Fistulina hepatica ATCC 64428]
MSMFRRLFPFCRGTSRAGHIRGCHEEAHICAKQQDGGRGWLRRIILRGLDVVHVRRPRDPSKVGTALPRSAPLPCGVVVPNEDDFQNNEMLNDANDDSSTTHDALMDAARGGNETSVSDSGLVDISALPLIPSESFGDELRSAFSSITSETYENGFQSTSMSPLFPSIMLRRLPSAVQASHLLLLTMPTDLGILEAQEIPQNEGFEDVAGSITLVLSPAHLRDAYPAGRIDEQNHHERLAARSDVSPLPLSDPSSLSSMLPSLATFESVPSRVEEGRRELEAPIPLPSSPPILPASAPVPPPAPAPIPPPASTPIWNALQLDFNGAGSQTSMCLATEGFKLKHLMTNEFLKITVCNDGAPWEGVVAGIKLEAVHFHLLSTAFRIEFEVLSGATPMCLHMVMHKLQEDATLTRRCRSLRVTTDATPLEVPEDVPFDNLVHFTWTGEAPPLCLDRFDRLSHLLSLVITVPMRYEDLYEALRGFPRMALEELHVNVSTAPPARASLCNRLAKLTSLSITCKSTIGDILIAMNTRSMVTLKDVSIILNYRPIYVNFQDLELQWCLLHSFTLVLFKELDYSDVRSLMSLDAYGRPRPIQFSQLVWNDGKELAIWHEL